LSAEERRLQAVTELLETIAAHSKRGVPIIVEGPNDVRTLRRLGITGPVICAKSRRLGLADFLDAIARHHEIIVLTDFDREGRALAWRLRRDLSSMRVKANVEIWKQLKALVRSEIVGIESLQKYLDRHAADPTAGMKPRQRTRVP
jgi:2,5-diamino-6-(ribosylamino)-4(3H)-pyrimidinone 5'-phosphate reductase